MPEHTCDYCQKTLGSLRGLSSHLSQSPACAAQLNKELAEEREHPNTPARPETLTPFQDDDADDPMVGIEVDPLPEADARVGVNGEPEQRKRRVTVEEVEDEGLDAGGLPKKPWIGDFPTAAGTALRRARTFFEELLEKKKQGKFSNYAPFSGEEDWELARWLVKSGLTQESIDQYLALPIVSLFN